jgi:polar amino acid transport system substrate-binding protein
MRSTFFLTLMSAACILPMQAGARNLQDVLNHGTLRVGVALASPWSMRDRDDELIGFDIDVAKQLAQDMGVEPEFIVYDFAELVTAIELDEVDIVIAGVTITPERALHVNFSDPYASSGITLATNLAKTAHVENLRDLDSTEYALGVLANSVAMQLAKRLLPRMQLVQFDNAEKAGQALIAGEIDAYLEELPVPTFLALDNPRTVDVPLENVLLETKTAFAVAKGDPDYLAFLNAWIIARESDTWLPTTHNYWFGSLRWRDRLDEIPDF